MNRITVAAFFTLASILSAGNALAQTHQTEAAVPFNFTVGNSLLPAGTYVISPVMDGTIVIQNRETHRAVLTQASPDSNQSAKGELVFSRHNGQYFLDEILCQSAAMNVNLPATRREKRARIEEAKLHNAGTEVLIATK